VRHFEQFYLALNVLEFLPFMYSLLAFTQNWDMFFPQKRWLLLKIIIITIILSKSFLSFLSSWDYELVPPHLVITSFWQSKKNVSRSKTLSFQDCCPLWTCMWLTSVSPGLLSPSSPRVPTFWDSSSYQSFPHLLPASHCQFLLNILLIGSSWKFFLPTFCLLSPSPFWPL
jgi:hypothetical protein